MSRKVLWSVALAVLFSAYGCEGLDFLKGNENEGDSDVAVSVESVSLNTSALNVQVGDVVTLTATVLPQDADNKNVTWSSSNPEVAAVASGKVTALAEGTAMITVTTEDGGKTASCTVNVKTSLLADVEQISVLTCKLNTPEDQVVLTWTGVENASGYECWYVSGDNPDKSFLEVKDNEDGTWKSGTNSALYPGKYVFSVQPVPAEGYALKDQTPASVEVVVPEFQKTGIIYRFMRTDVEKGVVYDTTCYDLGIRYKNIKFQKPDNTKVVANNWFLYTTTPVSGIHHLEMWYGATYYNDKQSIRVYSGTEPGSKEQKLEPDGRLGGGYWKVYYSVPEGHEYIYIEGDTVYDYLSRTSSYICH